MGRWFSIFVAGLLLTSGAGFAAQPVAGERGVPEIQVRPQGPGAPAVPAFVTYLPLATKHSATDSASPFGIAMYAGNSSANGQAQMQAAGATWETVSVDWSSIEPTAPVSGVHTYNWSGMDGVATRAKASGISLLMLFTSNPSWAAALAGGPVTPTHVVDLNNVVAAAAERYDGDGYQDAPGSPLVDYWSFYAEPDNDFLPAAQSGSKGYWGDNPNGYGDMIAGVARAMHNANPDAVVLIGGLAYDNFTSNGGHFVQGFLDGVLKRLNSSHGGAAATLGGVAFHYYPIDTGRWPTIKEKTLEIRGIMTANGVGGLPMLVPEMGYWSTIVPGNPVYNSSEAQQARVLVQMYVRGLAVGLRQMSWFAVFDYGTSLGTETHGLFRGTDLGSPKPSYSAYKTLTAELHGAHYASLAPGAGVEGYVFNMPNATQKSVVWATGASATFTLHQTCLRRVDYVGNVVVVGDGNPTWDKDNVAGQITLSLAKDVPLYVSPC
jgi:hypothetical protein